MCVCVCPCASMHFVAIQVGHTSLILKFAVHWCQCWDVHEKRNHFHWLWQSKSGQATAVDMLKPKGKASSPERLALDSLSQKGSATKKWKRNYFTTWK